jgi:hypothetical protein
LFEIITQKLAVASPMVFTHHNLQNNGQNLPLLNALLKSLKGSSVLDAIPRAVDHLQAHFAERGAALPFNYQRTTGTFTTSDPGYVAFINDMQSMRGLGKRSRDFECTVAERLRDRTTGSIHRVGHPRDTQKTTALFNAHLKTLGFDRPVLLGRDKDGGLAILWLLPLGAVPHTPFISVQCKNGEFSLDAAHKSLLTAEASLTCHAGLNSRVHVPCVLFNDYISQDMLRKHPSSFVPLGLTDLAPLTNTTTLTRI